MYKLYRLSKILLLTLVISMSGVQTAQATGAWGWAKRLPINQFTPEDIEILRTHLIETLENGTDGEEIHWSNPASGNSGTILLLQTVKQDDKRCRQVRFVGRMEESNGISESFLCQQPDGRWLAEQQAVQ